MKRCLRAVALATVLLAAASVAPALAANPPAPTSDSQPLQDGCQRSNFGIGFNASPEWVYVYRNPTITQARGTVRIAHGALQDAFFQHRSFDFNGNLVPDPPYRYLLGGSPARHTSNFAPGAPNDREEFQRLHFEWESATMPFFVWPTDGDRATIWGSWIWDCGHWQAGETNSTGVTTGEHTELHPLNAIAVDRKASYVSASGERETDVFVSNQGDDAHAIEQCALSHHPIAGGTFPQYDRGFHSCASDPANRLQPLASSYTFFVPAPPKPNAGAKLRYRIVNRISGGAGTQRVRKQANGLSVTVMLRGANHVVRYGKSFFVSWSSPPRQRPVSLKVTLKSILIKQSDPNPAVPDPSGANWNLYLDVNGYWQLLNQWAPRLTTHVRDGQRIAINRTVKIHVPPGAGVWLQVQGRECDAPAGRSLLGLFITMVYPCPANTDELASNVVDFFNNDDPGIILDIYRSVGAAIGKHISTSVATTGRFPGSGPISFGDGKQGQGDYQLTYTIARS